MFGGKKQAAAKGTTVAKGKGKTTTASSETVRQSHLGFQQVHQMQKGTKRSMTVNIMIAEGVEKLAREMGFNPESSAEVLVLMWICNCQNYGEITLEELKVFVNKVRINDLKSFQNRGDYLSEVLQDRNSPDYKAFYKFVFNYHREGIQKCVEIETCTALWNMLFGQTFPLLDSFLKFCEATEVKFFNNDQWDNVLEMMKTCGDSIENYDLGGAWPVLLDDFYEWMQDKK